MIYWGIREGRDPKMRICTVNVGGSVCGQPVAGEIHWEDEDYTDEACSNHLYMFEKIAGHPVTRYPTCAIEVLDAYSRVDLVECGQVAKTKAQWDERGAIWICPGHLMVLAEAN
jgi:hypothetical protein